MIKGKKKKPNENVNEFLKKKNYIKGFDRIAISLCVPMAIWMFFLTKAEYTYRKAVDMDSSAEIKMAAEKMLDENNKGKAWWWQWEMIGNENNETGVIASGKEAFQKESERCPFFALQLEKALELGADPDGDWINKKEFGLKHKDIFDSINPSCIVPCGTKRILSGLVGAGVFSLFALALTRIVKYASILLKKYCAWIRKGFAS